MHAIAHSYRYKWWVFCTIAIGIFFSVVDHGSVLVALPEIESHFGTNLPTVQWVVIGYSLVISVLLLPVGKLADIVGRKRVYVAGLVVYLVSSIVAGFAVMLILEGLGVGHAVHEEHHDHVVGHGHGHVHHPVSGSVVALGLSIHALADGLAIGAAAASGETSSREKSGLMGGLAG